MLAINLNWWNWRDSGDTNAIIGSSWSIILPGFALLHQYFNCPQMKHIYGLNGLNNSSSEKWVDDLAAVFQGSWILLALCIIYADLTSILAIEVWYLSDRDNDAGNDESGVNINLGFNLIQRIRYQILSFDYASLESPHSFSDFIISVWGKHN